MRTLLLAGLLMLGGLTAARGMPIPIDLVDVPVERIVANLEARLAKNPKDARAHHARARAHGIAYAQVEASIKLSRPAWGEKRPEPDEIQLADHQYPPQLREGRQAERGLARRHLDQAVAHYREAARLDPSSLPALLGYAWPLDLSGQKLAARGQYGRVLERAVREQELYIAREAGSYLVKLLDPTADAYGLAELKRSPT